MNQNTASNRLINPARNMMGEAVKLYTKHAAVWTISISLSFIFVAICFATIALICVRAPIIWPTVSLALISVLAGAPPNLHAAIVGLGALIAITVFYSILACGYFAIANKSISYGAPDVKDMVSGLKRLPSVAAVVAIIVILPYIFGLACELLVSSPFTAVGYVDNSLKGWATYLFMFLVRGIITVYCLPMLPLVVDGISVTKAIRLSARHITPKLGEGMVGWLAAFCLFIISCVPLGLGLFITIPIICLLCTIVARNELGLNITK